MSTLFARKPVDRLLAEAGSDGGTSLKRVLGPFDLTALGIGAVIGAGIFVLSGLGAQYAGPGLMLSFVLSGLGCAFAGLCYAEFAAMIPLAGSAYTYAYATLGEFIAWIIGWDLILEYAMSASTVSSGWSNHFIELLNLLHIKLPLWLSYDHWTGLSVSLDEVAHQVMASRYAMLLPGTQEYLGQLSLLKSSPTPDMVLQAHQILAAPVFMGHELGLNLPALCIKLLMTCLLAIGAKESAKLNSTIVVVKVSIVLFVICLGTRFSAPSNWGHDWHTFAPHGLSGIGSAAAYVFFAYVGFDAVSTTAQEAKNPQRDLPIGIIVSLGICTLLYIGVAAVLTGMVPWHSVNVEAPIAHAFIDRNLGWAANVVTIGALAGLTSVILVMLMGQTRVLYAMAQDGLLPKRLFAQIHPRFRTPLRCTFLVGIISGSIGAIVPINEIGKMVNIGTLLAFVIVCAAVVVLRRTDPGRRRPFRTPWVPMVPLMGILFNGYMMTRLGWFNWVRLIVWLVTGLVIYFSYGVRHSKIQSQQRASGKTAIL